jgi:phage gp36-like protein
MAYITNEDIERRLGTTTYLQLCDDDGDGFAEAGIVDEARAGAEGELDGYLARRYRLPIDLAVHADVAAVLVSLALDLVEHRLRARRPPVPEVTAARYARAIRWLEGVADGSVDLPSSDSLAANTACGLVAKAVGPTRVLSREELAGH